MKSQSDFLFEISKALTDLIIEHCCEIGRTFEDGNKPQEEACAIVLGSLISSSAYFLHKIYYE